MLYEATEICEAAALSILSFNVLLPHLVGAGILRPQSAGLHLAMGASAYVASAAAMLGSLMCLPCKRLTLRALKQIYLWSDYDGFHHHARGLARHCAGVVSASAVWKSIIWTAALLPCLRTTTE